MTAAEGNGRVEWVNVRVSSGRHVLLFPSNDGNTMALCVKASKKPGESYVAAVLRNLWEDVGIAPYRVGAMAIDRARNVAHVSLHAIDLEPLLVDPLQKPPVWAQIPGLPERIPDGIRISEHDIRAEAKHALEVHRFPVLSMRVGYLLRGAALNLDDPDVLALDGSIATEKLIKLVGENMTLEELHEIVEQSPKRRYRFLEDGKRVVALNGITQAMRDACPDYVVGEFLTSQTADLPQFAYHQTTEAALANIIGKKEGIKKFDRAHVHATRSRVHLPAETVRPDEDRAGVRINLHDAVRGGMRVFRTEAGVYLFEGDVPAIYCAPMSWAELVEALA